MTELTVLLVTAAAGFAVTRWTGLPAIPILILAGVVASALTSIPADFLEDVLTLGVTVLVFVAGVELNPNRVRGRGWTAFKVGLVQFVALGLLGLGAALAMGFEPATASYLALALTASSTLVVVKVLQGRRMLFEPVGRLVTGVLLLQDLLIIICIPIVIHLPDGPREVFAGVGSTVALMALSGILLGWVAPALLDRFAFDEETLLLLALSVLFTFTGLAHLMGLPLISGAFLAGVALSGFPTSALVRGQLNSLGDFFHALFFVALGAFLPLPTGLEVGQAALLAVVVVLVTPPLVAWIAEASGFSARPALASGLLLAQTSEFSLVVALAGLALGHVEPGILTVIALVTVATMILTPFLAADRVAWYLMHFHPFKKSPKLRPPPRDHILLLGCGRHGMALVEDLIIYRKDLVVVDDDPATVDRLRGAGVTALRGDISDVELLREVGADRARIVISTVRRREDNSPVLALVRHVPVLVRGFNLEDGEWIRERGGRPVLYSEAAAEDFQRWYETEWASPDPGAGSSRSSSP